MKKTIIRLALSIVFLFQIAAVSTLAAGTSGGIILKQGVGARAQGMGEAFVGVADDATSLYWNPGGLSRLRGINMNATYVIGLAESTYQQLVYGHSLKNLGAFGLNISLMQGGKIILDNVDGTEREVESQSDLAVTAGYGIALNKNLGLGLALKTLNSTLAEEVNATAWAADLGILLAITEQLSVGLVLQNAGTEIKYKEEGDPLPLTARLGVGCRLVLAQNHTGLLAVDLVKLHDRDIDVHMGVEYWCANLIGIRAGYKLGYEQESLTAGFGVHWEIFQLDYALGLMQELSHTHRVSLSLFL